MQFQPLEPCEFTDVQTVKEEERGKRSFENTMQLNVIGGSEATPIRQLKGDFPQTCELANRR